jgi:hypothetical protein
MERSHYLTASPTPGAYSADPYTAADIDAHPDADRIWATVITAMGDSDMVTEWEAEQREIVAHGEGHQTGRKEAQEEADDKARASVRDAVLDALNSAIQDLRSDVRDALKHRGASL